MEAMKLTGMENRPLGERQIGIYLPNRPAGERSSCRASSKLGRSLALPGKINRPLALLALRGGVQRSLSNEALFANGISKEPKRHA